MKAKVALFLLVVLACKEAGSETEMRRTFPVVPTVVAAACVVSGVYAVRKIKWCRNTSLKYAEKYYGTEIPNGSKADAFKHILVSVLLRKKLGRQAAHFTMFSWEKKADRAGVNEPRNKYMDLHNNRVGRWKQFKTLKNKNLDELAKSVHDFVETDSNGVFLNWSENAPDKETALTTVDSVSKSQYVYWFRPKTPDLGS